MCFLHGAGYHRAQCVKDTALNIKLHYLHQSRPEATRERGGKVMSEPRRNNKYSPSKQSVKDDMLNLFEIKLSQMAGSLLSRLNDNFQVLKPVS